MNIHRQPSGISASGTSIASSEDQPLLARARPAPSSHQSISHATLNSINVLMGVAILSIPFAFSLSGWVFGLGLLSLYSLIANRTAKMLMQSIHLITKLEPSEPIEYGSIEIEESPKVMSYADVGYTAFGDAGKLFIGALFTFELFAAATASIILLSDSLVALSPPQKIYGMDLSIIYKFLATVVLIPTTFPKSLKLLSYFSMVGIFTIFLVIAVLVTSGVSTTEYPGSLHDPAPTSWFVWSSLPLSVGLLIVGVDAHAVFPSIYHGMKREKIERGLNYTYLVLLAVYGFVGAVGYLMYGDEVESEVTVSLKDGIARNVVLWMVAVNPATKYALIMNPVNLNIEATIQSYFPSFTSTILSHTLLRTLTGFLVFTVAITFPGFHRILALIGAACSSIIAIVFPVLCYQRIVEKYELNFGPVDKVGVWVCRSLVLVGGVTAVVGTVGVFM